MFLLQIVGFSDLRSEPRGYDGEESVYLSKAVIDSAQLVRICSEIAVLSRS